MTIYGGNFQFFLSRISFKLPIVLMVYKDEKRFAEVIFKGCMFLKEIVAPRYNINWVYNVKLIRDHRGGRDFTSRHAIMMPALLCCFIYGMLYFHLLIVCYSLFLFYQVRLLLRAGFTYNTCSGKPFARLHHSACKSQRTVLQPSGAIVTLLLPWELLRRFF